MDDKKEVHYVVYEVHGFPGQHVAGPYKTEPIAEDQRNDILGYPGVHACYITTNPPKKAEKH